MPPGLTLYAEISIRSTALSWLPTGIQPALKGIRLRSRNKGYRRSAAIE
jgi:hypothetical protein